MSLYTTRRLYKTLRLLARTHAEQYSYLSAATFFNADLAQGEQEYPWHGIIASIAPADEQTCIGDLLVRTGQLLACLEESNTAHSRSELTARDRVAWRKNPVREVHLRSALSEKQLENSDE